MMDQIFGGVWKMTFGTPEEVSPVRYRAFEPDVEGLAALCRSDDSTGEGLTSVGDAGELGLTGCDAGEPGHVGCGGGEAGRTCAKTLRLPFDGNDLKGIATKRGY